jgi:hypothetical protein
LRKRAASVTGTVASRHGGKWILIKLINTCYMIKWLLRQVKVSSFYIILE